MESVCVTVYMRYEYVWVILSKIVASAIKLKVIAIKCTDIFNSLSTYSHVRYFSWYLL